MTKAGHNSVDADHLLAITERIERLEADKKSVVEDIKHLYMEAKSNGYDCKALRKIVALRAMDEDKRKMAQAMLDLYAHNLGLDLV
tara:strand:- start:377 stop:634 length:258 start_codon:yes stop_codon:yes gene_type:complete